MENAREGFFEPVVALLKLRATLRLYSQDAKQRLVAEAKMSSPHTSTFA